MAKLSDKQKILASFKFPTRVEVRAPEFEPLDSLQSLDFARLQKGNHKIELGFVKGSCCRKLVRAVVKNGMVTGCEIEPCKDSGKAIPSELKPLVAAALKKAKSGKKKWKPTALRTVVNSTAQMQGLIIFGGGCIFICCFGHCIMCCWYPTPHCFIPTIFTGPL